MPKTNHLFSDGAKERENMKKILALSLLGVICFMPAQLGAAAQVGSKECIEGYVPCLQNQKGAVQCYRKCQNKQGTTLIVECESGRSPSEPHAGWKTSDGKQLYAQCWWVIENIEVIKKNTKTTCRNNSVQCTGHHGNALKCAEIVTKTGCITGVVSCKKGYKAQGPLGEIADIGTVYAACIVEVPANLVSAPAKKTTTSTPAPVKKTTSGSSNPGKTTKSVKKTTSGSSNPDKTTKSVKKNTSSSSNPDKTTTSVKKNTSSSSNSVKTTTTTTGTCAKKVTRNAPMDEYLWVDSAGYEFCATKGARPANDKNKKCYDCNEPTAKSSIPGCEVKKPGDKILLPFGAAVGGSTTQGADSFVFECTNDNKGDKQTSHKWKALPVEKVCLDVGNNEQVDVPKYGNGKLENVKIYRNAARGEYCLELPEKEILHSVTISGDNSQVIISEQNASRLKIKRAWARLNAMSGDFKVSVWRDKQGNFNTARLASDSIAAVVLGTTGALVTSNIVKKNQVSGGFEDISCQVGGQTVAGWGDQFSVGIQ